MLLTLVWCYRKRFHCKMQAYSCKSVFAAVSVHFSATIVCSCNSGTVALAVEENHRGALYERKRRLKDTVDIVNRILQSSPFFLFHQHE